MSRDPRTMNHMDPDTKLVHARLEAWGQWAHDMEAHGWPPSTILGKLIDFGPQGAAQGSKPPINMPDEIAKVDSAVARLGEIDKKVIVAYYTKWQPVESVARDVRMRVRQVYNVLRRARWRLSAFIEA